MQNYSKVVRPAETPDDAIVVRYGVALQQIIDMVSYIMCYLFYIILKDLGTFFKCP